MTQAIEKVSDKNLFAMREGKFHEKVFKRDCYLARKSLMNNCSPRE